MDTIKEKRIAAPDEKRDFRGEVISILSPGTVLKKRYKVSYFTAGGMSVIYTATDIDTGLDCIIKEIIVSREEENFYINSFFREKELLSKLYHPGIVNLLDFFEEHNGFYLVLEYVDGIPSDEFIKKNYKPGRIPLDKILYWSLQLCDIMAYLHNMSPPVIYRDLKPENILIDRKEKVKLIDFGIARTYKEGKIKDTETVGSPGFASPEQYGKSQTDCRSDIYSFGVFLHYLLTGIDPREKEKSFVFEEIKNIPSGLKSIVEKTLERDPKDRFQTVAELKRALERIAVDYPSEKEICNKEISEYEVTKSPGYKRRTFLYIFLDILIIGLISYFILPWSAGIHDTMCGSLMYRQWEWTCRRNIQDVAASLETYKEKNGKYPVDLTCLEDNYIKNLPLCPHSNRGYGYTCSQKADNFTLYCSVPGSHPDKMSRSASENLEKAKKECYPQYSPSSGIISNWENM
ncbi:MAG: serine/threonine-protein kinase [Candidatus Eremiobacterota bacterium]